MLRFCFLLLLFVGVKLVCLKFPSVILTTCTQKSESHHSIVSRFFTVCCCLLNSTVNNSTRSSAITSHTWYTTKWWHQSTYCKQVTELQKKPYRKLCELSKCLFSSSVLRYFAVFLSCVHGKNEMAKALKESSFSVSISFFSDVKYVIRKLWPLTFEIQQFFFHLQPLTCFFFRFISHQVYFIFLTNLLRIISMEVSYCSE